jgi:lipoate-protein ligase A
MYQLRLTLPTPPENVALDEALLEASETGQLSGGVLRLWESPDYFVVLGRSSDPQLEVNREACRRQGVPVLRRSSGGGTILAGPGCLMYAVVIDLRELPHLRTVDAAHRYVLGQITAALAPQVPGIAQAGISDLVLEKKNSPTLKISGNALRIKRDHFLYHGTLLYDFDLDRIGQLLATPTRVPDYREQRGHGDFVANLPLDRDAIEDALLQQWSATEPLANWPRQWTAELVAAKYRLIE